MPLAFSITLLRFLESLAESIVPVSLHPRCLEMNDRDEAFEVWSMSYSIVTKLRISDFCFMFLSEMLVARFASAILGECA